MNTHETTSVKPKHVVHEGPRNHYISYIVSIVLTMLAFAAVLYGGLNKKFIIPFLLVLALAQIAFQLIFWMHMKDKNHEWAVISIIFGGFIAAGAAVAGIYWMWW